MSKFVLTYHGEFEGMPTDPAEMEAIMAEWGAWYGSMGDALVDGGSPFGESSAVAPDGSTTSAPASMTGYTIVDAADIAGASAIAQGCPVLKNGHTVQINQAIEM